MQGHKVLNSRLVIDISCCIASMVISGNICRSSLLALLEQYDDDVIGLKNFDDEENKYRVDLSWASNNSVKVNSYDEDFSKYLNLSTKFGELLYCLKTILFIGE